MNNSSAPHHKNSPSICFRKDVIRCIVCISMRILWRLALNWYILLLPLFLHFKRFPVRYGSLFLASNVGSFLLSSSTSRFLFHKQHEPAYNLCPTEKPSLFLFIVMVLCFVLCIPSTVIALIRFTSYI